MLASSTLRGHFPKQAAVFAHYRDRILGLGGLRHYILDAVFRVGCHRLHDLSALQIFPMLRTPVAFASSRVSMPREA